MINAEEKLERFSAGLLGDTWKRAEEIVDEAEKKSTDTILGASERFSAQAKETLREKSREIHSKYERVAAAERFSSQKELLAYRQELTDRVFEETADKLLRFSDTPEYGERMREIVSRCAAGNAVSEKQLRLSVRDYGRRKEMFGALLDDFEAVCDKSIRLGGIKIVCGAVMMDYSYDAALEDRKNGFRAFGLLTVE